MKVTTNKQVPVEKFLPRSITLHFESQAELDTIGRLFNTARVCDVLAKNGFTESRLVYLELEALGARISPSFHDEIKRSFIQ